MAGYDIINSSDYTDEIRAMLKEKGRSRDPSYRELSEIIGERFGIEISPDTLRKYSYKEIEPEEALPPQMARDHIEERAETIDIAAQRAQLVELQMKRREKAMEVEENMDGLVMDATNKMIQLEDSLLSSLSSDYERLGILDSVTAIDIEISNEPSNDPFADLFASALDEAMKEADSTADDSETAGDGEHYSYDPDESLPGEDTVDFDMEMGEQDETEE